MTSRPVDMGWASELINGLRIDPRELKIICPFIKARALDQILVFPPASIRVITRFNLADFTEGTSDIAALQKLLDAGATVRGIRNLHAKLYLFGSSRAIITSANLTNAGLWRNHEFGFLTDDRKSVEACRAYFDDLWHRAGDDLQRDQLEDWSRQVTRYLATGAQPGISAPVGDFGAHAGIQDPPGAHTPPVIAEAPQAFVKFLGQSANRVSPSFQTLGEIEAGGCHWCLCYPNNRRPRSVEEGAVMFIARLTDEPDIRVFGRAIGMKHEPGRDDATPVDTQLRSWIGRWPHYIRVHHAQFVRGTMANGVSLYEMMDALQPDSFETTRRNTARGDGNINPRRAYMRSPHVRLSTNAFVWLNERLHAAFKTHGVIPPSILDKLDWPDHSNTP